MKDIQPATSNWDTVIRWIARLSSLAINSVFLLILFLAVTNEDKPQGAAIPVLVWLVLTMVSCLAAWRWERAGGIAVFVSAGCLGVAAYAASRTYGAGPHFLAPLLYCRPLPARRHPVSVGGQRAEEFLAQDENEDLRRCTNAKIDPFPPGWRVSGLHASEASLGPRRCDFTAGSCHFCLRFVAGYLL